MLWILAAVPFFSDRTAASTSLRRMGWSSSVSVWGQFSTNGSPLALWLYSSEKYSVHLFSMCWSSVWLLCERSWTVVAFPCFTMVKSFARWYALLLLFFLRFSSIRFGMVWLLFVIVWWVTGKVQPGGDYPSPGRTRGRRVHRGTLPPVWPLSSYYEAIRPVMPCWHQLFHP